MSKPRYKAQKSLPPQNSPKNGKPADGANSTTDAIEQPKGRQFKWVSRDMYYRTPDRSSKDILTYKEALIAAESVYIPNRRMLYDLYKDIELDGFLSGIREKLIDSILNKSLKYAKDGQPIDGMDLLIESQPFHDMCREILITKFWGITGLEFIPGAKFHWNEIDRKHIKPKWRIITRDQYGTDGDKYDDYWNLWIIGKPKDLGIYLVCAFYVLLKKGVISNWAEFIELYGLPTTVMKYESYDEQTKNELRDIIKNAGSALQLVIPKQADHEIHDTKNTANGDVQDKFRKMANEEMVVMILGATETTTSTAKSGGHTQSNTHADQQAEKIKALMKYLVNQLNDPVFINILYNYGYPVTEGAKFVFDKEVDINYIAQKKKVDQFAINAGLPVSEEYLYRTYAIDKPAAGETLLQPVNVGAGLGPAQPGDTEEPDGDEPNKPTKKPSKTRQPPSLRGTKQPFTHSKLRNLLNAFTDFFAQAR